MNMFKKKCGRCKNKVNNSYDFCPVCGNDLKSRHDREDYGILGKNDFIEETQFVGDSAMDKMLNGAFKMAERILEKQMRSMSEEMVQNQAKMRNDEMKIPGNVDVQFFVNGKRVFPNNQEKIRKQPIKIENNISEERAESFAKLPKKEAVSKVRRLSGKIIYELEVPGVDNINDVLINQLENSIEVKAISDKEVYHKILNVNLPILNYGLDNGNLVLELQAR